MATTCFSTPLSRTFSPWPLPSQYPCICSTMIQFDYLHTVIPLPRMLLPSSVPLSLSLTRLVPPHIPVNRLGVLSFRNPPRNLQVGLSVPLDFHIFIFIYHFTVQVVYFCLSHLLPHWTRSYSRPETRAYLSSYSKGV